MVQSHGSQQPHSRVTLHYSYRHQHEQHVGADCHRTAPASVRAALSRSWCAGYLQGPSPQLLTASAGPDPQPWSRQEEERLRVRTNETILPAEGEWSAHPLSLQPWFHVCSTPQHGEADSWCYCRRHRCAFTARYDQTDQGAEGASSS